MQDVIPERNLVDMGDWRRVLKAPMTLVNPNDLPNKELNQDLITGFLFANIIQLVGGQIIQF